MENNCLICKFSELYPEQPGYSEYTPGSPAYWECGKNMWKTEPLSLDKDDFLKLMDMAKTCKHFKFYKE